MKKTIYLILISVIALTACRKDDLDADVTMAFGTPAEILHVSKEKMYAQGVQMFADTDTVGQLIASNRIFHVNEPLKVSVTKEGKIRLYNFMAHTFRNLDILMVVNGRPDTIRLMKFEEVPPMYEYLIDSPFRMGERVYENTQGKPVRFTNLELLSPEDYHLFFSCKDTILKFIRSIKVKTQIQMGRYGEGNWDIMNPSGARYLATCAINMAVMFSSPIFRDSVMNYPGLLPDNDKITPLDRELLMKRILTKEKLVMGLVINYAGLGGGSAFGLSYSLLPNMFYHNRFVFNGDWSVNAYTHEYGHCIGYGHGSAMCYGVISDRIAPSVYAYMMKHRMLPFIIDPLKKYNDYVPTVVQQSSAKLICNP